MASGASIVRSLLAVVAAACIFPVSAQVDAVPEQVGNTGGAPSRTVAPRWALQLPKNDPVAFKGIANFDAAGIGTGPMMYPAPGAAGLIAAVLVHGLISESAKNAEKIKLQEKADEVLVPYRPMLSAYTHADLMRSLTAESTAAPAQSASSDAEWLIDSVPTFSLTQDQAAIVLENAVTIRSAGDPGRVAYQSSIRIVSAPMADEEPVNYWSAGNGARLRKETADLLKESIDLAVSVAARSLPANAAVQKTYRYREGRVERVERAALVVEGCSRLVLRTLRDTLISVPLGTDSERCIVAASGR